MDKQGNLYTFIYAAVMVIIVASTLALVSQGLKPRQVRNEMVAKKTDILQSVNIASTSKDAEAKYEEIIGEASYIVNFQGEKVDGVAFDVDLAKEVRKPLEERLYPVYEARLESGELKYVLQFRGNGLWGPLWGYVSLNDDGETIYGATFGHKSETPGLGAEIANDGFQAQFKGKEIFNSNGELVSVAVVKGGAPDDAKSAVDAVSGGTITSEGLQNMLSSFFEGYEQFLKKIERERHE
ncbi:NADH:ubiquinone reductase (Na(+)-transporting) subunit C [Geofilum rubicundum]|uniref:Na(+)-translocating NADH-quinone reductase subunit C n=1 Tax=Geofilum rubicundum JCM 15548 TaxID=1236989 RepID=A0A0E9LRE4_9BACT|nr:NADH:ubiquinone reductase (Na(+)-transporting) subunit C [Geofilum rubicundum]GAO28157.1 Na(+)-translocating NADH-quinone reductase subunit C [Geofilum rubicundum JCM 15548]